MHFWLAESVFLLSAWLFTGFPRHTDNGQREVNSIHGRRKARGYKEI